MAIICRIGYCQYCANSRSPRTGQHFLAYGSTAKSYHVLNSIRNGKIGFVPHLYKAKIQGNKVKILKSCAMDGCGVDVEWTNSQWYYQVRKWKYDIWTLETWEALLLLKHNVFTYEYEI